MIYYNKLVRDKIPEIIQASGKKCNVEIINDSQEIIRLLEEKAMEEWAEYKENRSVEEIADVVEVLFSLSERLGMPRVELINIVNKKSDKRGAFKDGIFLISVDDLSE